MKSIVNGLPLDSVVRVDFDTTSYFFSKEDFKGIHENFEDIKNNGDYMEHALFLIFQTKLGLTWSFLQ